MRQIIALLLLSCSLLSASPNMGGYFRTTPHVGKEYDRFFQDFFLGAGFALSPEYSQTGFTVSAGFSVRPYSKEIIVLRDMILYQYREHRITFEAVAEKDFFLSDRLGFYVQGGGMATIGWYRGTTSDADNGFSPIGGGGITIPLGGDGFRDVPVVSLKMGYRWEDVKSSSPHSFSLSFVFLSGE